MKRKALLVVALACAMAAAALAAQASDEATTPLEALERLFTSDAIEAEWFAPIMLENFRLSDLEQTIWQLVSGLGEYQGVTESGEQFVVSFEGGDLPAAITLDAEGKIAGLFFHPPRLRVRGLQDTAAVFEGLPGEVSLAVYSESGELVAIAADKPLSVGSSAKLAILAALEQQIQAGVRRWDDVVLLDPAWKSLPTGVMQEWPDGAPVTLHTLATQMISISDNTATDGLIHVLGREAIEPYSPRNAPFLTTREVFTLMNPANAALLERYRAEDTAGRRSLLEELQDAPLPGPATFADAPNAIDVGWYLTTQELCGLMSLVRHLEIVSVNPGVTAPDGWAKVSYKGGSLPGALNLTTWLDKADGGFYCVSATWNDEQAALDEIRFYTLYMNLIEELKELG